MKKKVLLWIPLILFLLMTVVTALVYRYFGQPWAGICAFVTYGGYMLHSLLTRKKRQQEQDEELQQLEKELAELAEEEEPAEVEAETEAEAEEEAGEAKTEDNEEAAGEQAVKGEGEGEI